MGKTHALDVLKKNTMLIVLVLVVIFFCVTTGGKILYPQNINNLISQNGYVFILATGMLLCILTGGNVDLSVGSVVCFTGGIGAVMMDAGMNCWLAVLAMLAVGLLVGMFQGFWIAYVKVPPFIATLAGMYAFRGLSNVVLNGYAVTVSDQTFLKVFGGGADCYITELFNAGTEADTNTFDTAYLNYKVALGVTIAVAVIFILITFRNYINKKKKGYETGSVAGLLIRTVIVAAVIVWFGFKLANYNGIPTVLVWIVLVLLIYQYITTKTATGRYLYAVGGNEKATRLSGVNTKKVYFLAYANMGLLAGLAGILTIARASSVQPTYGQGYEMDAIAACFIGGASAYGGTGSIGGTVIGAVLMGVINQGMSIMGMEANYQKVVKGLVLLVAVIFDVLSKKEKQ